MGAILKQGDTILIEEKVADKLPTQTYIVKISKDTKVSLEELFEEQRRANETIMRFIIRQGIGRIVPPKAAYLFDATTNSLTQQ